MVEEVTTERYIAHIVFSEPCGRHQSAKGEPCFEVPSSVTYDHIHYAVCDKRARKAGMTGNITRKSYGPSGKSR